ncbi:MAG: hypothetical protein HY760_00440 [Nitrospirae bacterium]|nr:hypothetical protein [Nitrospirota bacterium]
MIDIRQEVAQIVGSMSEIEKQMWDAKDRYDAALYDMAELGKILIALQDASTVVKAISEESALPMKQVRHIANISMELARKELELLGGRG